MKSLLLVCGSKHKKIAHAFLKALRESGYAVSLLTDKSTSLAIAKGKPYQACVWLISPQTLQNSVLTDLHQVLRQRKISIIPVLIEHSPAMTLPKSTIDGRIRPDLAINKTLTYLNRISGVQLQASHHPSPKAGFSIVGIGLLGLIFLLSMGAILASQLQTEEALPTLVAFDLSQATVESTPLPESLLIEPTQTQTILATPIQIAKPISSTPAESLTLEATEEITAEVTEEATEEVNLTPSPEPIINTVLTADFLVDTPYGDAPLSISVDNLSSGEIQDIQWDFNSDGVIDSLDYAPFEYIYYQPGIYTITLTIRDKSGRIAQSQSNVEVFDPAKDAPSSIVSGNGTASFVASPANGKAPLKVTFINRSQGSNLHYEWDFNGDGNPDATGASPRPYTYTSPGSYTAYLTVISANGSRNVTQTRINAYSVDPKTKLEQIYPEDSQAKFTISKSTGTAPLSVEVANASTGTNNLYEWDFNGDGKPDSASAKPPAYRYLSAGTYTLSLTVRGFDRYGVAKNTQTQAVITVMPQGTPASTGDNSLLPTSEAFDLQADFSSLVVEGPAPLEVQFYNYSTGNIVSYQWDFDGNGSIDSTEYEPVYTYVKGGSYEARLTVSDGANTSSTSLIIDVFQTGSSTSTPASATPKAVIPTSATPVVSVTSTTAPLQGSTTTLTATATPTGTPANTQLPTASTATGTAHATLSLTPTLTATISSGPSSTPTSSPTAIPTLTFTPVPTATFTPIPTLTFTPIPTATFTPIPTLTFTPIPTATYTPVPTLTFTPVPTSESG